MMDFGRIFIILGVLLLVIGIFLNFSDKIPFIGKLPGDILIKKEGFTFYFPLTTSIIISLVLSILFRLFNKG
jgi:hypothetical protein